MTSMPTFAERLNDLFATRLHPTDRREYTNREVAQWLTANGCQLSGTAVWNLRNGTTKNPTISTVQALAKFFGVRPGQLLDDADTDVNARLQAALSNAGVEKVALKASGLSDQSVEALAVFADQLLLLEQRDSKGE